MLTEYSTYDDIRKFRDKAVERYSDIMRRWLNNKLKRKFDKMRHLKPVNRYDIEFSFVVDHQKIEVVFSPVEYDDGKMDRNTLAVSMITDVETRKGKMTYSFGDATDKIFVGTPHFFKRQRERKTNYMAVLQKTKSVPYIRNGRKYELYLCDDVVMITRRIEHDIIMFITFLSRDMCTSENYQALLERAGKDIDEHDIYEWK